MPVELIHAVIATVFLAIWAYVARIVLHECCRDARTRQKAGNIYSSIRVDERHMEGVGCAVKAPTKIPSANSRRSVIHPSRHAR